MANLSRKLSKDAKVLLLVGIMYASGMTIAATFVNVYLIRLTNDMGLIILQNIVNYAVLLGAFVFASFYVSKGSILRILRIGILSTILYYTLILVLKENASKYLMFIGAFNGLGMGFYYFSFNILLGKLTDENNRSAFLATNQPLVMFLVFWHRWFQVILLLLLVSLLVITFYLRQVLLFY